MSLRVAMARVMRSMDDVNVCLVFTVRVTDCFVFACVVTRLMRSIRFALRG